MDETGLDEVQFLMSANVGEDLKPIQKIASGGELARIMLALKNVLAENDQVGALVFDEVDTGVSGRAAQKVAEKLAGVARTKQVLCRHPLCPSLRPWRTSISPWRRGSARENLHRSRAPEPGAAHGGAGPADLW